MDVAGLIKSYRLKHGMTQKALANLLGCTPVAIANYEAASRMPSITTRLKLADILGIPYHEIIEEVRGAPGHPVLITDPTLLKIVAIYSRMSPRRREAMLLAFLSVADQTEALTRAPEQPAQA